MSNRLKNMVFILANAIYLCSFGLQAKSSTIKLNNQFSSTLLTNNIYIYTDKSNALDFNEVENQKFILQKGGVMNLGISKHNIWVRFEIQNNTNEKELYLKIVQPVIDSISLYSIDSAGHYKKFMLGEYKKYYQRFVDNPNYIFPVVIEPGATKMFYLKVRSSDQIQMPMYIGSRQSIMEDENVQSIQFGLYAGVILIMILYNAFLSVTVRDKSYVHYIFYIFFVGLTQAVFKGYAFKYLWPSFSLLELESTLIVPVFSGITTGFFMKSFMDLKKTAPKLNLGVTIFILLYVIIGFWGLMLNRQLAIISLQALALCGSLYALVVGFVLMRRGLRSAFFFMVAYSVFLAAVIVFVLCNFNVLPYNNFTANVLEMGSALQIMLLSLALADKINTYRKERSLARMEALKISRENEVLIREQNINLEKQVQSRTVELQTANQNLHETLNQLKATQTKLVDAEKMASLGQLTAGIAHEINNPINFVAANIKPLELDIKDIFEVINRYEKIDLHSNITQQLQEIESYKSQLDLDYIGDEIDALLMGIKEGANRTAEIVKNLKNFARIDQDNLKLANLNEGIESTLVLVRNAFPSNLKLQKDLGELPEVECIPGKINQVFMNIITNAVYAIKVKKYPKGESGILTLKSWHDGETVKIAIEDNGIGMSTETISKIFEPFFTTKDVGKGTGLGMSIVKGIMDSHQGSVYIDSNVGEGTKFILTLPVKASNS